MDIISAVILHYKNPDDTRACLESVLRAQSARFSLRIIVVANSDENNFTKRLGADYPLITIIKNDQNGGFAQGNNLGIKYALSQKSDYIMLLNNDTVIDSQMIIQLYSRIRDDDSVGLVSPKIFFAKGFEFNPEYKMEDLGHVIWYAGGVLDWKNVYAFHRGVDEVDKGQYEKEAETGFNTGCCMMFGRNVPEKSGLMNEKYFLYYEDVEFSVQVKHSGYKLIYLPKAYMWHKNASSSGRPGSDVHVYYQTRNRLYFGMKFAPLSAKKSLFWEALKMVKAGGVRRTGVLDYFSGRMNKKEL